MSYVVLARKYRPRSFEQMVGQEHVVRALTHALEQQRLHHAYLFTGTRGVGKTTVSRILAKSLNCIGVDGRGGITARPCGVCGACTEIDADRYIDYIELDAASNRGIDEIRDLLERAAYKPSIGRFKVFMIDEAHQLTKESFNALLKTLEEPPEYLKFVLATTDPEKMLPTVLSRCLQFNLRPMAPDVVQSHLAAVLDAEAVAHEAPALRLLARAARGSMRDALSLADQAIAYGGGRLELEAVRAMLGSVDRSHAGQLVEALARRDGRALLAGVDALRGHGLSAAGTLEEMAGLLQQMAVEQAVPGALDAADPDTPRSRELAALLPADETQLLYSIVIHGRGELDLAPDEYAGLTMVLLRLLAFAPQPERAGAASSPPPVLAPVAAAPVAGAVPPARPQAAVALQAAPRAARAVSAPSVARPPVPAPAPAPGTPPSGTMAAEVADAPAVDLAAAFSTGARSERDVPTVAMPEPPPWLDDVPPEEVTTVLPQPDVGLAPPLAEPPAAPGIAPVVPLQTSPLGDRWAAVVADLSQRLAISALTRELAVQAELLALEEPADDSPAVWRLRVERESLRTPALRDKLQMALAALLGRAAVVQLEAGVAQDSPARRDAAARLHLQREAERVIQNDPLVQQLMAQFKTARIVPGSIKPHRNQEHSP